ncbi:PTS sugar transporter subunit IIB [Thermoactinomyces mirandus]|uniref:PTS sugar transporter subunit IIB n=1 Tax=Thermoactinomyces mirandus TaxID=2756294 RepID=A0A7W2ASG3_9BACL|nr:PTS sugar transporter subunit IIB [Thermoactinomyces mirandus]MBA4603593.1 PTS sugar transporter subunit IIB [Thermoactinomyces mirandus]
MKVLFVCSGGMSSAIVVNALKKEAEKHSQDLEVKAVGSSEVVSELENKWDVVMVAPQIKHRFDNIKKVADEFGTPCGPIPPQAYTPLGGPELFKTLKELIK